MADGPNLQLIEFKTGALEGLMGEPGKIPPIGVWEASTSEVVTDFLRPGWEATDRHKIMRLNLEVFNSGNMPFEVGNVLEHGDRYSFGGVSDLKWFFYVVGFYRIRILDGENTIAERDVSHIFASDAYPALGNLPPSPFGFLNAGLSPGFAATNNGFEYIAAQTIDITDVPDGDYDLEITIDDKNWAGQKKVYTHAIGKRGFDIRPPEISIPL